MKKWLVIVFELAFLLPALGASVQLAWDASVSMDVTGYRIYIGPSARVYTNTVTLSNVLTCTLTNLNEGGTYFFTATAYNGAGLESDFSNEISYTVPDTPVKPGSPSDLRSVVAFFQNRDTGYQLIRHLEGALGDVFRQLKLLFEHELLRGEFANTG